MPLRFCGPQQKHEANCISHCLSIALSLSYRNTEIKDFRLRIGKENYEVRLRTLNHVA